MGLMFNKPLAETRSIKESFETVVNRELPILYRVAKRLASNSSDAEDLVGGALLLAARAWSNFDGRHPRSWLIRILKNEHLGIVRKRSVRPEVALDDIVEPAEEGFWQAISWKSVGTNILSELDQLPEEYRLAVTLCDVEELSYEEASEAMEVPVGTVRSRLFRGRRLLRARLVGVVEGFEDSAEIAK